MKEHTVEKKVNDLYKNASKHFDLLSELTHSPLLTRKYRHAVSFSLLALKFFYTPKNGRMLSEFVGYLETYPFPPGVDESMSPPRVP